MQKFTRQAGQMLFHLAEDIVISGQVVHKAGEKIMLAVTPADTNTQTEMLDTYLGGFRPFGFLADRVSPIVLVDKEAGQRRDHSKENAFEVVDPSAGRHGAINEIDHKSERASYETSEEALACFIPFAAENDADKVYQVRSASGRTIMNKLALWREIKVWTDLSTAANWNANNRTTLTTGYQWDGGASADPLKNLQDRIKNSAQPVTDIWMNPTVAFHFLRDSGVRAFMTQLLGDNAPTPALARGAAGRKEIVTFEVPGLPPVTIVPGQYLNASGQMTYILGDSVVLTSTPVDVPMDGETAGTHYTFRTRGRSGTGVTTNEYMPQGRGIEGGTMLEAGWKEDRIQTCNIAGGAILDVLAAE